MKKMLMLAFALVLSLAVYGEAAQGGEGNNTGCNGQGNANSPCGTTNNGGQGGDGGNATIIGSGNSSASANSVNVVAPVQKNTQQQGQAQSQRTKQANTQTTTVEGDETPRQAPPAYAPALATAPETCMGSVSGGASTPFGGIAIGTTYKSESCEVRMFARLLAQMGIPQVALELLIQNDERVAKAAAAHGITSNQKKSEKIEGPTVKPASLGTSRNEALKTSEPQF